MARAGWAAPSSVRLRIMIVAVAVAAVTMVPGAFGLVTALRAALENSIESSEKAEVARIASLLRAGAPTAELERASGEHMTQVVDASRVVRLASPALAGAPPLTPEAPGRDHPDVTVMRLDRLPSGPGWSIPEGPWLLVSTDTASPRGQWTVHVVASLRAIDTSMRTATAALGLVLPALVLVVGIAVRVLADRTLRPVEAIRAGAADIARRTHPWRVPEPRSRDEVGRLARTMNEMLDRLEASAARERSFVADASHELRSPLAAIQAHLDVALAHPERTDWPATAREIALETQRMQRIVEDLLLMAKADVGASEPRTGPVDLDELVLAEARRLHDRGRVEVDVSKVSAARVSGDRDQLTQVVRNLLVNAERHAALLVRLELDLAAGEAVLVVADDGPGIPAADRERVFERFTRLDEARSRGQGGAGLGLAIVRQIVEAHGGTVTVADEAPGARFTARLPAGDGA